VRGGNSEKKNKGPVLHLGKKLGLGKKKKERKRNSLGETPNGVPYRSSERLNRDLLNGGRWFAP